MLAAGPRERSPGYPRWAASAQRTGYTAKVAELTERAVSARVPSLARETLRVVNRRDPLTVFEGTSLGHCLRLVEGSGIGNSVVVTAPDGTLRGVLTERDIFGVIVGGQVDLDGPGRDADEPQAAHAPAWTRPSTRPSPCSPTGATATCPSSTTTAAWSAWSASRTSSSTSPRRSRRRSLTYRRGRTS